MPADAPTAAARNALRLISSPIVPSRDGKLEASTPKGDIEVAETPLARLLCHSHLLDGNGSPRVCVLHRGERAARLFPVPDCDGVALPLHPPLERCRSGHLSRTPGLLSRTLRRIYSTE